MNLRELLKSGPVEASAPCRIDLGGTLDLSTFFLPLRHLRPCTFNAALDLRTMVKLSCYEPGKIKVSSVGFESVEVKSIEAPFDQELGLMLAVAGYFNVDGVHIDIHSCSPPRSALGGSSAAAAALIWSFFKALNKGGQPMPNRRSVALLAHVIEQSVAGVPCGMQDQLAAVYGGVNVWHWLSDPTAIPFKREHVFTDSEAYKVFGKQILVAYCGIPHASKDVNSTWVRQFVSGKFREEWHEIVMCSKNFVSALASGDYSLAAKMMNLETEIRVRMTPDVLDDLGVQLVAAAQGQGCGARFTGAGGGGCVWALGEPTRLSLLQKQWENILMRRKAAKIIKSEVDAVGLL